MRFLSRAGVRRKALAARLPLRQRLAFIALTLLTALATAHYARFGDASAPAKIAGPRALVPRPDASDATPFFRESWVTPAGHTRSAHSSAICALPSGDLMAVWYGGTREGARDVALFTARLAPGGAGWSEPVNTVDRALAAEELERTIKKVGNAVVFPNGDGALWMVYVSVSLGGWSGSALNLKTSRDEGRTWSASRRLTLNPFLNLSSLVRNKPIYASDGRIGLPVYHEMAIKFPQILWLTPGGDGMVEHYRMRNLASEHGLIQPTLVPLGGERVLMLLRDRGGERAMHTAYSEDSGWTWSQAAPSGLPNPDAAIDALRLRDGRILLVYNHAASGRENLRLAISADDGRTWRAGAFLEETANQEFSYPNLVEDRHGRIHLTYTWQRQRIKHVAFNLAWLDRRFLAPTHSAQ
jgi:predicted neuraminidase